jgi:signal transduction histidine kinase
MPLHPPTIFVVACWLAIILGCLQLWLWRQDRKQSALAWIGSGFLTAALGALLLAARGQITHQLSVVVANALILVGYALIWTGMRKFRRRPPLFGVIVLGPLVWILACQIPAFFESFLLRLTLASILSGAYSGAGAWELLRNGVDERLPSSRPLAALLIVNATLVVSRIPLFFLLPQDGVGMGLPTLSAGFGFISLTSMVVFVGIAMLMVALAKEQAEQRSIASLAAARDASERANEEKSRFLARMSHELRTLLNSVHGMAQSLAKDPGLTRSQRDRAATLERAGRHLVAIVNDSLDLGRIEAGRLDLSPRAVDLRAQLREAIDLIRASGAEKRVTFKLQLSAPLPAAVLVDPVRLRQILLNLLGNAVKFSPEGGQVSLAAMSGKAGLTLTVTDAGPGVAEEYRARLFQDYERIGAEAAGTEGTGLGLAITAALAEAMGGRAWYAPGPGGIGSCFSVTLPLLAVTLPEEKSEAPTPAPAPVQRETLCILVVDDIAANRMVAEALLGQLGHQVQSVGDGPSAIALIERGPLPDVVLMDIFMPGMDGYETTRRIRALPPPAGRVPILAVTAEAGPEEVRACLANGMNGHIAKPIDRNTLLRVVDETVRMGA